MKRNKKKSGRGITRKTLAVFLAASMLLAQVPMAIYAEDAAEKGLCTHHTQHTEECGYREAKEAVPCSHICSAESGCITTTESCVHTHDTSCGYAEAVEAKECKYVKEPCPDCKAEAKAAAEESEKAEQEKQQKIQTVQALIDALPEADGITAENLESVKGQLAAIEEAKSGLDESSQSALHLSKYTAAVEKTAAVEAEQEKQQKIQTVQALIDALPEADGITAENLETVKGQLAAIEEAKAGLDESSQTALNLARYTAAAAVAAETETETESETETEKPKLQRTQKADATTGAASVTIGDQTDYYDTLKEALNAANGKTATITVLKDVDESSLFILSLSGNITLIGGDYTIKFFEIDIYGGLTIESGNIKGGLYIYGGTLNVNGGVFSHVSVPTSPFGGAINIYGGTVNYAGTYNSKGIIDIYSGTVGNIINNGGTVNFKPVNFSLNKSSLTLAINDSEILTATVSPSISAPGFGVSWESSDTSVATVNNGTITAVGEGTAVITATAGDKTATCSVEVVKGKKEPPSDLQINYSAETINTTTAMEYSEDNGTTWKTCTENMTVASMGWSGAEKNVLIRTAETDDYLPSNPVTIIIPARPAAPQGIKVESLGPVSLDIDKGNLNVIDVETRIKTDASEYGSWKRSGLQYTGLRTSDRYTVQVRKVATTSSFASVPVTIENCRTASARYEITIPKTVAAGGDSASIEVNYDEEYWLGTGGQVDVKVKSGLNGDGTLALTRENDTGANPATVSSQMMVDGQKFTDLTKSVAVFYSVGSPEAVAIGFESPTPTENIPAGTYTGTVTFEISYSEP